MKHETFNDDVHVAALKLQSEGFAENYLDCAIEAQKRLSTKAKADSPKEDTKAAHDARFEAINEIANKRGITFTEACDVYERDGITAKANSNEPQAKELGTREPKAVSMITGGRAKRLATSTDGPTLHMMAEYDRMNEARIAESQKEAAIVTPPERCPDQP